MERKVELSGGPLAGHRWPARRIDRTLWIGIGADGSEYDGNTKLSGIAIYERAADDAANQFSFSRLEGPGARIAELGRRITAMRAGWATGQRMTTPTREPHRQPVTQAPSPTLPPLQFSDDDAGSPITRSVIERWQQDFSAAVASSRRLNGNAYIGFIVPGEAEQFIWLLAQHGIPTTLMRTTTQIRRFDSEELESLPTGNVLFAPEDIEPIAHALNMPVPA